MSVRVLGATGGWISGLIPKESCAPSKKWWRAHQKDIIFFYNIQKRGRWKSSNCDCICQLISIVRIKVTASDNRGGVSSGICPVMLSRILRNLCSVFFETLLSVNLYFISLQKVSQAWFQMCVIVFFVGVPRNFMASKTVTLFPMAAKLWQVRLQLYGNLFHSTFM